MDLHKLFDRQYTVGAIGVVNIPETLLTLSAYMQKYKRFKDIPEKQIGGVIDAIAKLSPHGLTMGVLGGTMGSDLMLGVASGVMGMVGKATVDKFLSSDYGEKWMTSGHQELGDALKAVSEVGWRLERTDNED